MILIDDNCAVCGVCEEEKLMEITRAGGYRGNGRVVICIECVSNAILSLPMEKAAIPVGMILNRIMFGWQSTRTLTRGINEQSSN